MKPRHHEGLLVLALFVGPTILGGYTNNLWLYFAGIVMSATTLMAWTSCYRKLRTWADEFLDLPEPRVTTMSLKTLAAEISPFACVWAGFNPWAIFATRAILWLVQIADIGSMERTNRKNDDQKQQQPRATTHK